MRVREFAGRVTKYVDPLSIPDYAPTGLQVESGRQEVARVALAVSANLETAEAAADWNAQALVVHHGLFWHSHDPEHDPARPFDERRSAFLRANEVSLLAFHLPLDAHPEVGNNVQIAKRLGFSVESLDFAPLAGSGVPIGVIARAPLPMTPEQFSNLASDVFGQETVAVRAGDRVIERIAIVSGGGTNTFYEAIDRGVDALLTGEGREWTAPVSREAGVHFFAAGHHASEQFGIQALGDWIVREMGMEVRFFAQDNPF